MSELVTTKLPGPGLLALVGSGEYLSPIEPLDRWLLAHLNEPARVACLPTAAGTEGDARIDYWCSLGVDHFSRLGAQAEAVRVIDRSTAQDPSMAERVRSANFVYLSGGKPAYLYNSLHATLVWEAIIAVLQRGGVVAGCSAGAMIFGERIPTSLFSHNWQEAFNFLPGSFIIPHFDEIPRMMLHGMRLVAGNLKIIGIAGSTALVCGPQGVSVQGLGSVALIENGHKKQYKPGAIL